MHTFLKERIDYGRKIRAEADLLLSTHGHRARRMAIQHLDDPGLPELEKAFRTAVAERVQRFVGNGAGRAGH